jgi:hypothetical protein
VPITVTLANRYVATKKVSVTAIGNTARYALVDNIVLGAVYTTFDVYVFSGAGAQIASPFQWLYQGV